MPFSKLLPGQATPYDQRKNNLQVPGEPAPRMRYDANGPRGQNAMSHGFLGNQYGGGRAMHSRNEPGHVYNPHEDATSLGSYLAGADTAGQVEHPMPPTGLPRHNYTQYRIGGQHLIGCSPYCSTDHNPAATAARRGNMTPLFAEAVGSQYFSADLPDHKDPGELVMIGGLARALERHPTTIRNWVNQGIIPPATGRTAGFSFPGLPGKTTSSRRRTWRVAEVNQLVELAAEEHLVGPKPWRNIVDTNYKVRAWKLAEKWEYAADYAATS